MAGFKDYLDTPTTEELLGEIRDLLKAQAKSQEP